MSLNPIQRRLDAHLVDSQKQLDDIALNVAEGGASQADSYAFLRPAWIILMPAGLSGSC